MAKRKKKSGSSFTANSRFENDNVPIEGAEPLRGDAFRYGKKKAYVGATEHAYQTTNVPRGRQYRGVGEIAVTSNASTISKKSLNKARALAKQEANKIKKQAKANNVHTVTNEHRERN